jgi:hypothetical protein
VDVITDYVKSGLDMVRVVAHCARSRHITRIKDLPDVAQRKRWAELINRDVATLYRAQRRGALEASKPDGRTVLITKRAILKWLGITE